MYKVIKRMLDFISATMLFILISPLFIIIAVLIKVKIGSPIFFKQKRTGYNQEEFELIKFRTMTNQTDKCGNLLPDCVRLTKLGSFLRNSSLDELPELLSIIVGKMSVIGPRPLPVTYNKYYTEEEKKRFLVKGGLIPPDTLNDNPIITWEEQLMCEAKYAENLSFKNDIKIFFGVFKMLFKRKKENYGIIERKKLDIERGEKNELQSRINI